MKHAKIFSLALLVAALLALPTMAFAADGAMVSPEAAQEVAQITADAAKVTSKSIGSGIAIGIASAIGALAMGIVVAKSAESVARQPEASGQIRSLMMLGLVFIETAIIYALLSVILIIFVL